MNSFHGHGHAFPFSSIPVHIGGIDEWDSPVFDAITQVAIGPSPQFQALPDCTSGLDNDIDELLTSDPVEDCFDEDGADDFIGDVPGDDFCDE